MKVFVISLALTVAAWGAGFDVASVKANTSGLNDSSSSSLSAGSPFGTRP